ncbi:MAG: AbrB/MazE/SpoVT family DNA-binding domain-containing protein [Dehalococcoidales bacterium]|nr:AbrB/MazE/SpoVT family DNA-binding domain-containing protein [Dehalococcoidales bacterium]
MPIIEVERKLFATGDSLAVTLPKAWTHHFQLKAGDIVEVVADDDVIIRTKKAKENIDFYTDLTGSK